MFDRSSDLFGFTEATSNSVFGAATVAAAADGIAAAVCASPAGAIMPQAATAKHLAAIGRNLPPRMITAVSQLNTAHAPQHRDPHIATLKRSEYKIL
jgi:hypothetical protein